MIPTVVLYAFGIIASCAVVMILYTMITTIIMETRTPKGIIMFKESNHRIKEATEQMCAGAKILASDILNLLDKSHPNVGTITQALGIVMDKMQLMVFRVQDVQPSQSPLMGQKVTE
jgi:hypothetical protein